MILAANTLSLYLYIRLNCNRSLVLASTSNLQGLSADNSKVALWQFNSLDVNGDELLTAHEVKEFKRYIKKNVKPKVTSIILCY